jgi:hypothetical protein
MQRREDSELANALLQLIGASPDMAAMQAPEQQAAPSLARGGTSSLIQALRGGESKNSAGNPGISYFDNPENGAAINFQRTGGGLFNPAILKMLRTPKPTVQLPKAETGTPYVKPIDPVVDDFDFKDIVIDDVVDEDVVDDVVDDGDVLDDPVVDVGTPIVDGTVVDDDTVEDDLGTNLDTTLLTDLVVPEEKEKTGIVDMEVVDGLEAQDDGTTGGILDLINAGLGDNSEKTGTVDIEVVDPNVDIGSDDGTTQDILDLINYLDTSGYPGGIPGYDGYEQYGQKGGGKAIFDETLGALEF